MNTVEQTRRADHNAAVLANAIELTALAARGILGKEVGTGVGGSPLKDQALTSLIAAKLKNKLAL